ncbi:MAG: ABC transporter ATP-binding protein/permease, partial [Candidatus Marinimicrobia bacterium]|nr:ABC transporter ATP-binding protein/permease [Candidatus Neomarinimicrobiota bacterium]
ALGACIVAVCLHACSGYILTFYTRIVVDHVLEVRPQQAGPAAPTERPGGDGQGRTLRPSATPDAGAGRRLEPDRPLFRRAPEAGRRLLILFLVYVATILFLDFITRRAQQARIRIGRHITGRLRNDVHHQVLKLSLAYHRIFTPGRLLSRIISDIEVVQQQMMASIFTGANCLCMIAVGLGILFATEWRIALVALVVLPVYAMLHRRMRPELREINRELRHTNSCLYALAAQKLDAIRAIQAHAREPYEVLNFHRLAACFLRDAVAQNRCAGRLSRAAEIVSSIGTTVIFLMGAHWVLAGEMSLGVMLFLYGTTATLFAPVLQLTQLSVIFNNLFIVLHRIVEVLDEPPSIIEHPQAQPFPAPLRQGITLTQVSFRYPTSAPDAPPALNALDLQVNAGEWLCVMGPSGSGKTTLLYLLSRLYEPLAGTVHYDQLPLPRIQSDSLRRYVGLVPQEAQIFSGTVRDNICYGFPEAEPAAIVAAARAAELHDFIMQMPVKYEALLGEKGVSLSGGQRQRLSLARTLLTNPNVLLLDDCTSALDAETERRIQETLARVLAGKTAVIVSQRVSMARRCDRICVLEQGRITEIGTPTELLNADGFYARLHRQQTE